MLMWILEKRNTERDALFGFYLSYPAIMCRSFDEMLTFYNLRLLNNVHVGLREPQLFLNEGLIVRIHPNHNATDTKINDRKWKMQGDFPFQLNNFTFKICDFKKNFGSPRLTFDPKWYEHASLTFRDDYPRQNGVAWASHRKALVIQASQVGLHYNKCGRTIFRVEDVFISFKKDVLCIFNMNNDRVWRLFESQWPEKYDCIALKAVKTVHFLCKLLF